MSSVRSEKDICRGAGISSWLILLEELGFKSRTNLTDTGGVEFAQKR